MRYTELAEHNKGDQGQSVLPATFFDKLDLELFHYFHRDNEQIDVYKSDVGNQSYYVAKQHDEIVAYVYIQQYDENVWQVKGSYIYDKQNRGKGIGTELYMQIVLFDKKKLISDDQLSDSAEKLWTESLPKSGKDVKIYDAIDKKVYSFIDAGKAVNNVVVLDPKNDNERDRNINTGNFKYSDPRFYYLLEFELVNDFFMVYRKNRLGPFKHLNKEIIPPLTEEWINEEKLFNWSFKLTGSSWY